MIFQDDYLFQCRDHVKAQCKNVDALLDLPLEANRAHFVVRNLQHALSQAMAIENELRGVARPRTSRE